MATHSFEAENSLFVREFRPRILFLREDNRDDNFLTSCLVSSGSRRWISSLGVPSGSSGTTPSSMRLWSTLLASLLRHLILGSAKPSPDILEPICKHQQSIWSRIKHTTPTLILVRSRNDGCLLCFRIPSVVFDFLRRFPSVVSFLR